MKEIFCSCIYQILKILEKSEKKNFLTKVEKYLKKISEDNSQSEKGGGADWRVPRVPTGRTGLRLSPGEAGEILLSKQSGRW